jgi:hypothetical protein
MLAQIGDLKKSGPLRPATLEKFRAWIAKRPPLRAAGQAIVIGGATATDIRILHNTISGSADGIHVGVSRRGPRGKPLFAERVQIIGNTVVMRIPRYESGSRAGIFVGNARFSTIRDNRVADEAGPRTVGAFTERTNVDKSPLPDTRPSIGIRVWGVPGPFMLVNANWTERVETGIRVVQVGNAPNGSLWEVSQNIAVDTGRPIQITGTVATTANAATP